MTLKNYQYIVNSAVEAVFANKVRSILTALGIIFGVAAVIAMMAIGSGAQKEILEQIKMVGVNNIIIQTRVEDEEEQLTQTEEEQKNENIKKNFSLGLSLKDAQSIRDIIPGIEKVSPEVVFQVTAVGEGVSRQARLCGVTNEYFDVFNLNLEDGSLFNAIHLQNSLPVCILGPSIKARFFKNTNPLGKHIKCGNVWFTVIGTLENRLVTKSAVENLGISDNANDIYAPISTVLLRHKDRSLVNSSKLRNRDDETDSDLKNYHQLDKIVVQVTSSSELGPISEIIKSVLLRKHAQIEDFEIIVPELLLKQEQKTRDIFNVVLGAIAGISLLVGGIGIMNIMLASVMERIKEIGIRKAIGARRKDIIFQFLTEATLISITGGIIGIILGVTLAALIMKITGILTIVSYLSIIISFGVAATVGIAFGYMPAKKAAEQDPVTSLRYE